MYGLLTYRAEKTDISASLSISPVSRSSSAPVGDEAKRVSKAIFDSYVYNALICSLCADATCKIIAYVLSLVESNKRHGNN